jgi:hypothetical protein
MDCCHVQESRPPGPSGAIVGADESERLLNPNGFSSNVPIENRVLPPDSFTDTPQQYPSSSPLHRELKSSHSSELQRRPPDAANIVQEQQQQQPSFMTPMMMSGHMTQQPAAVQLQGIVHPHPHDVLCGRGTCFLS